MTLVKLDPGLVCKKCKSTHRMTLGRDAPGTVNMVLTQDQPVRKVDFECMITCELCNTIHRCEAFVRDGIFQGVHKYDIIPENE